ncbi:crocetin glucosyltransferase, chloroplastic-like [Senna tora]|uniref:Crocetin glucosyltransferase, chloroplastic-like n=2 Tax=Senna tora TaxID=362788 RepID=A0A834W8K0_9FABA|nr:crocetin glucosyltransferase, chloroplastic-like [Senna tora]
MAQHHHFLLIVFPAQGQLNPYLQFAKRLIAIGARVTLLTTVCTLRRMTYKPTIDGLTFAAFSDGYDDGFSDINDDAKVSLYCSQINRLASEALTNLITTTTTEPHPFTAVIYSFLFPCAAEVARELHLPSALMWTQPATVLNIYYYYLRGFKDYIEHNKDPNSPIKLPKLPLLTRKDLPSFLHPSNIYSFALPALEEHFRELEKEVTPTVLVNIFEALEPESLRAVDQLNTIPIGPLIPSAFLDGNDPNDVSFGGDIFRRSGGCIEWLDSKPERSVVYVSFGSLSELSERQMKEIARALSDSGRPFLWVIRDSNKRDFGVGEDFEGKGKIVNWCSQVEVLSHSSIGRCLDVVMGSGEKGEEIRRNAVKWKGLAKEAVKEGGSSDRNLRAFVNRFA